MAIQPQYAQAILSGAKTVEFRKRRLAEDVRDVLIYESSPTQRVVGSFTIERCAQARPADLWREFGQVGCIDRASFDSYYAKAGNAVALVVGEVRVFEHPIPLTDLPSQPGVPQSFVYLPVADLEAAQDLQPTLIPVSRRTGGLLTRAIARTVELVAG